jgi:hypothetical protein
MTPHESRTSISTNGRSDPFPTKNPGTFTYKRTSGSFPKKGPRVPHISLVFREMWETTALDVLFIYGWQKT